MSETELLSQKIGDIVLESPRASQVFRQYQIDFCCGGQRTLQEALTDNPPCRTEILRELEVIFSQPASSQEVRQLADLASNELIDHIEEKHHTFVRRTLPEISEDLAAILRAHYQNHGDMLTELHRNFHHLRTELEQHLVKEEEVFFPEVRLLVEDGQGDSGLLGKLIEQLGDEHEEAGSLLKNMRSLTDDYQVPKDGCATFAATYDLLQKLEADLFEHIHLENNVLFGKLKDNK